MPINAAALALIRESEGLRLEAYPDPARGWDVPTIGYGHTSAAGKPEVVRGLTITEEEAELILLRDLVAVAGKVEELVTVPLNENELGALVSFAFNLGTGALAESTLLRKLNDGDRMGCADQFGRWIHAGRPPRVKAGLVKRRAAERALFLTPVGGSIPAPVPTPAPTPEPPPAVTPEPSFWVRAWNWLTSFFTWK